MSSAENIALIDGYTFKWQYTLIGKRVSTLCSFSSTGLTLDLIIL